MASTEMTYKYYIEYVVPSSVIRPTLKLFTDENIPIGILVKQNGIHSVYLTEDGFISFMNESPFYSYVNGTRITIRLPKYIGLWIHNLHETTYTIIRNDPILSLRWGPDMYLSVMQMPIC